MRHSGDMKHDASDQTDLEFAPVEPCKGNAVQKMGQTSRLSTQQRVRMSSKPWQGGRGGGGMWGGGGGMWGGRGGDVGG